MMFITEITTQDGAPQPFISVDKIPDECPVCHAGIEPLKQKWAHFHSTKKRLEVGFRCPKAQCQSLFLARYVNYGNADLSYSGSYPIEPRNADFSSHIRKISPSYCAIANEAQKADNGGWKLIAGPGYRKALEFLIKDYLCLAQPDDAEQIKKLQLGSCITAYVKNEKVKLMAARAAWLGNDETHYTRKWGDKDLEDLKTLIQLTVHWIEMKAMTSTIVEEMPEGKKP
jgi:hypothetical protein